MAFHTAVASLPAVNPQRRALLFHETLLDKLERWTLGMAWALHPKRIENLPAVIRLTIADWLGPADGLPDPECTLNAVGLVGMVHDLSVPTLVQAYRHGLFTLAHLGPLKWYSPPERSVLFFDEIHIPKRLRRQIRQDHYKVTFDRDFEGVIAACAKPRAGKWHVTWITPRIMHAYARMFDAGYAHSFEVWNRAGELVGGGYGVAVGHVFFTESQFSLEPNTSKIGFTVLNWHLAQWGFALNDGKWETPTIATMGFRSIPRAQFRAMLASAAHEPTRMGRWQVETDLKTVADWQLAKGGPGDRGSNREMKLDDVTGTESR